jgi:copper homeostasis protein
MSLPLHVIIRPRGGDFCYSEEEFDIMRRDIEIAKRAGADGAVLGILLPSGRIDITRTRQLMELARPMSVTFHRAFDMSADLQNSLEEVCQSGVDRLLTSGGEPDCLQGTLVISKLVQSAGGRIHMIAGGGINAGNVAQILRRTGVNEIHVGLATVVQSPMLVRNASVSLGKAPGREYHRAQVLEESVRELKRAIAQVPANERREP